MSSESHWVDVLVAMFPAARWGLDTQEKVDTWETEIRNALKDSAPKSAELIEVIRWASAHESYAGADVGVGTLISWVRHMRAHHDEQVSRPFGENGGWKKPSEAEREKVLAIYRKWTSERTNGTAAVGEGYRELAGGEAMEETDEVFDGRAWIPLGKYATERVNGRVVPRRLIKYRNTIVRRKAT